MMGIFGNKKEQTEFRGVSVSNEKRNAIVLFVIEAIVVVLFIGGVLAVLNYVGIISLTSMNPTLFGWLPNNGNTNLNTGVVLNPDEPLSNSTAVNQLIDKNIKASVKITSDIPQLNPNLTNTEKFIQQLRDWTVYGRTYTDPVLGSTDGSPLSDIEIILTSTEMKVYPFSDSEGIFIGSGYKFNQGKLELSIYLAPRVTDLDKSRVEALINRQVLISLLALPKKLDSVVSFDQALTEINAILAEQNKTKSFFINLE